jgi:hypothetical protein
MISTSSMTPAKAVSPEILRKVATVATKASYEAPKVVSFPVSGMKPLEVMAFTGNF